MNAQRSAGNAVPFPVTSSITKAVHLTPFAFLGLAASILCVLPVFFPNLRSMTGFAEAAYINNGRLFVEGKGLSEFGYSPLATLFYAITYLPVQWSPNWLVYSCMLGRIILFTLVWTSAYLVTTTLTSKASRLTSIALLITSPAIIVLIAQGAHALFAAAAAFALWQVLLFYEKDDRRHLFSASFFIGAGILARSGEGMVLWYVLLAIAASFGYKSHRLMRFLVIAAAPCAGILALYVLLYVSIHGKGLFEVPEYPYSVFEAGQGLADRDQYRQENFYSNGMVEARQLFGTPEQNNYSVIKAISNNPTAYLKRFPLLVKAMAQDTAEVYGFQFGLVTLLFAIRGAIELIRTKSYSLLTVLSLWCSYFVLYLLLCFQPNHMFLSFYVVLAFTAIGITAVAANLESKPERYIWLALLAGLAAYSVVTLRPGFFFTSAILLLVLTAAFVAFERYRNAQHRTPAIIAAFIALFAIHADFLTPSFGKVAPSEEGATQYLTEHLQPGSIVGAYQPLNIYMAHLNYMPMYRGVMPPMTTEQDLLTWIDSNHVEAIYTDRNLKLLEPRIWDLVQSQIGRRLKEGFTAAEADFAVLLTGVPHSPANVARYIDRPWYSTRSRFAPDIQR